LNKILQTPKYQSVSQWGMQSMKINPLQRLTYLKKQIIICTGKSYTRIRARHSTNVQTLSKAFEARDHISEGHTDRLQSLVTDVAVTIGLSNSKLTDLRIFAQFHDVGKVGIPDRILFKEGPLTADEILEMQRHSEIGFRIAQSSWDLAHIADWILKHHEWWNGDGYPFGLKGEDIPVECRILAIADAYDAMTNDRPYRQALSHDEAVKELKKNAGVQFDSKLVENFINIIEENQSRNRGWRQFLLHQS